MTLGTEILSECHHDGVTTMRQWLSSVRSRFNEVQSASAVNKKRLDEAMKKARNDGEAMDSLMKWLCGLEAELDAKMTVPLPRNVPILEQLKEHNAVSVVVWWLWWCGECGGMVGVVVWWVWWCGGVVGVVVW